MGCLEELEVEQDCPSLMKLICDLGDLTDKRLVSIETEVLRRYAPLPPDMHCPSCGAALSQAVEDWRWSRKFGAWRHYCEDLESTSGYPPHINLAISDSEPLQKEVEQEHGR